MIHKIARFTVKKEQLQTCLTAIQAFVAAIQREEPGVLYYSSFQLEDEVSFLHLMSFRDADAERHHQSAAHTRKFVDILYPNCVVEPHFETCTLVAATNLQQLQ
jgi:quinol monooxygenase YgiN